MTILKSFGNITLTKQLNHNTKEEMCMKKTVDVKTERKEREVELAWRQHERKFAPRISKEQAWDRFEELHARDCR